MKKHTYKKSTLVLYIYTCLLDNKKINIKDIVALGVSRATAYQIVSDISLFIFEFNLHYMELINNNGNIEIKIKK